MKKLILQDERVKVKAHFQEQGSILQGTKTGRCEGFEIELLIESAEPVEAIAELLRLAHQMCFTESALSGEVQLTKKHFVNGEEIEVK